MAHAIAIEDSLTRFYQKFADQDEAFGDYAKRYAKRKTRIEAVRKDYVTEMILEPISGLNIEDYTIQPDEQAADRAAMLAEAIRLEAIAENFYAESSLKLNVTEAIRAFQKFAQENAERLEELKSFAS